MGDVTYDRPQKARLMVRLENGEEWEATPDDLARFRYVSPWDAYRAFYKRLERVLRDGGLLAAGQDITDSPLNPVRYLVELALTQPDLLDHPETVETYGEIVALALRLEDTP